MICPKCRGEMTSYERNGINVDQCVDCRGIFLDRGELEHLVSAEDKWASAPTQAPQSYAPPPPQHESRHQQYAPTYDKRKKKRSIFEDLFD